MNSALLQGEVRALEKRGITEETCAKFGYHFGTRGGVNYHIAPYYKDGELVAQHLRTAKKAFSWVGDAKNVELFGQHLWRDGGKKVVITEGEIDCMTVSQLQNNKWPVVSIPSGADSAKKALARNLPWLNKFEEVILMFDMDDAGAQAIKDSTPVFPPGKVKVARLALKDANELLLAGRGGEVIDAIWGAKAYRPDGIVTMEDIRESMLLSPETGLPWVFPALTKLTYGRRYGEVYCLGAGTGVGKTDALTQQIAFDVVELKQSVAVFFLEQQPSETGKRIAGKVGGKRFHVPDAGWTPADLTTAMSSLDNSGRLFMYDHFGSTDWSIIKDHIRYLAHSEGVRLFYVDHLTALASVETDERKALEIIMAEVGGLVKELNIIVTLVSHLATPDGKPHEEGGRVMIRHFKGSRAIGFWCHFMFGMERDQQATDKENRTVTTFRVLKDRYTGQSTGELFYLGYDTDTGRLFEREAPTTTSTGFKDETSTEEQAF
jgi:twinkle protein